MLNNTGETNSANIGFFGLLGILFIGLKLTGYINWSWIWVLSPLWVPLAVLLVALMVVFVIALLMEFKKK